MLKKERKHLISAMKYRVEILEKMGALNYGGNQYGMDLALFNLYMQEKLFRYKGVKAFYTYEEVISQYKEIIKDFELPY